MAPKSDNKWSKWHVCGFKHCFKLGKSAWVLFLLIDDSLNIQRDSYTAWEDFGILPRESVKHLHFVEVFILQLTYYFKCCFEGREDNLKEWILSAGWHYLWTLPSCGFPPTWELHHSQHGPEAGADYFSMSLSNHGKTKSTVGYFLWWLTQQIKQVKMILYSQITRHFSCKTWNFLWARAPKPMHGSIQGACATWRPCCCLGMKKTDAFWKHNSKLAVCLGPCLPVRQMWWVSSLAFFYMLQCQQPMSGSVWH